jgi:hypothetical protein
LLAAGVLAAALAGASCGRIRVNPTCPEEIVAGDEAPVTANVEQPGAIPTYRWSVSPADAGRFLDATKADTTFIAERTGDAVLFLLASDSIFVDTAQCDVRITAPTGLAVTFTASPMRPRVGEITNLSCVSVGQTTATSLDIEQTAGFTVTLTPTGEGTARFTPDRAGDLTFECVGSTPRGRQTASARLTLTVEAAPPPDNDNANDNANENTNDNGNANTNDNGNVNDNSNQNDNTSNDNANTNENGNTNANANDNASVRTPRGRG